jgi:hypothetical protein
LFDNLMYELRYKYDLVSTRIKKLVLIGVTLTWLVPLVIVTLLNFNYIYTLPKAESATYTTQQSSAESLLKAADDVSKSGGYGKAFKMLATARNNFAKQFTDSQLAAIGGKLRSLTAKAKDTTIAALYNQPDLTMLDDIYKFKGYVLEVSVDDMYGVTCTVADSQDTHLKSLEVYGLTDVAVGSTVQFYGVPEFYSVTGPMRVEGF